MFVRSDNSSSYDISDANIHTSRLAFTSTRQRVKQQLQILHWLYLSSHFLFLFDLPKSFTLHVCTQRGLRDELPGSFCSSGEGTTHWRHSFRTNLGFSILLKDALACGLQVAGVKPVTFETPYRHQDVRHNGGRMKVWLDLLFNKILFE